MGPVKLAQMTGAPLGEVHLPEKAWVLNSWDRFLVPKPFTRIVVSWVKWIDVPKDLPADQFEAKRQGAERRARLRGCGRSTTLGSVRRWRNSVQKRAGVHEWSAHC